MTMRAPPAAWRLLERHNRTFEFELDLDYEPSHAEQRFYALLFLANLIAEVGKLVADGTVDTDEREAVDVILELGRDFGRAARDWIEALPPKPDPDN